MYAIITRVHHMHYPYKQNNLLVVGDKKMLVALFSHIMSEISNIVLVFARTFLVGRVFVSCRSHTCKKPHKADSLVGFLAGFYTNTVIGKSTTL